MKRTGFTLIELLVVITVIAILASLALGCIGLVRDLALRTSYGNNMRQVSLACLGYAQEQENLLPTFFFQDLNTGRRFSWMDLIGPYADQSPTINPNDLAGSAAGVYFAPYYQSPDLVRRSIFHDPIDRSLCTLPGIPGVTNRVVCNLALIGRQQFSGSWLGHAPGATAWSASGRSLSTVKSSSTVGLVGPGATGAISGGENGLAASLALGTAWGWTAPNPDQHLRYRGRKAPFGFIDGHIEVFDANWFTSEIAKGLSSPFFDESARF